MRAVADRWGWKELVKIALVLSRGVLGLFVSAALGFVLYVVSLPVVLSTWGDVDAVVTLLLLTTGIGSGIGSFATWFDRNHELGVHVLLLAIALTCALIGAWLGYQRGLAVDHPIWRPGLPETNVTWIGAVISANAPLFLFALYRAIRDPRL